MPVSPSTTVWRELLQAALQSVPAGGGAVWLVDGQKLSLAAVAGLNPEELVSNSDSGRSRQQALAEALTTGEGRAVVVTSSTERSEDATLVLIHPLVDRNQARGALELAVRPAPPQTAYPELLQRIRAFCQGVIWQRTDGRAIEAPSPNALAPVSPSSPPETSSPAVVQRDLKPVVDWLLAIQQSLNLSEVAAAAVNDGRQVFGVDRMSLAIKRGRKARIIAVSGQEKVHPRSSTVRGLARLVSLVMTSGDPLQFPLDRSALPHDVEMALADYLQLSGVRYLLIVPLRERPKSKSHKTDHSAPNSEGAVIGAAIFEQMAEEHAPEALRTHLDAVTPHLATAVHNAQTHESLFLLPVWRALGALMSWMRLRRLVSAAIVLGVAGATAVLIFVPWEYRVEATGHLMPVVQRDVFAPWDGQVQELLARSGQRVNSGDVLLTLRNDELQTEFVTVRNDANEKRKLLSALHAELAAAEKNAERIDAVRLQGRIVETGLEIQGLNEQRKLLEDRLARLTVRAPIDGVVTTFQAEQELTRRPVTRGDVLLQVMDDRGDWRLELEVQEQRLGHILKAQRASNERLPIEFRLLTQPESTYHAQLTTLATRAETSEESGNVLEVHAAIDAQELPQRTIGAEVRGRIGCGPKPLGYVMFGDVIEFVQRYLWW